LISPTNIFAAGTALPLIGEYVQVHIIDFCAEVQIHQRFKNITDDPIEAVYPFLFNYFHHFQNFKLIYFTYKLALPDGVAVCNFCAFIGEEKIEGKLKEKEKARETYDDAIAKGNTSFLLEQGIRLY
jgi:hypothetical protein